ncbi:MAG: hypothetical protein K2G97_01565 [Oscillospiraceae bacterium]|nr:hypothetical protein [Oscillospiraceae bacterium]
MKIKIILSVVLIMSIIATSFSSVVQVGAQTERSASNQAAQVTSAEETSVQTAAKPLAPVYEFVISNEEDFALFMTTPVFWGSNYKITLAHDINMKGKAFKPIKEFGGVFDGCGHTVSNLKIQDSSIKIKNPEIAFINTLNEFAEFRNVTFDNYIISDNSMIKIDTYRLAGLIITNHGTVSDVDIVNGSINNIFKNGKLVGFVYNNAEEGIIENCFIGMNIKYSNINAGFVGTNFGKIEKCSTTLQVDGGDLAGGFVSENAGIIERCCSKGDVSSKKCAGGFCSSNTGEIISCKSEGSVKAHAKKVATICGGFLGVNSGVVKDSSSKGMVEGQEYAGGFVGVNDEKGEISFCKSICDVKSYTLLVSVRCGGFVGADEGKIENCTSEGKVSGYVDTEKVIEIGIGTIVGVAAIITAACLLTKKLALYIDEKETFKNSILELGNDSKAAAELTKKAITDANKGTRIWEYNGRSLYDNGMGLYRDVYDKAFDMAKEEKSINEIQKAVKEICINAHDGKFYKYEFGKVYDLSYRDLENGGKISQTHYPYQDAYDFLHNMAANLRNSFIISLVMVPFVAGSISCIILGVIGEALNYAYVGGFCGYNSGEINKCSANSSSMEAKTLSNKYNMCGGFIGTNGGIIKDSVATGNEIHNKTYTDGYLGGFVGDNSGKIENGTTNVSVANGKCTGGFCGSNSGEISGSSSEGSAIANAKTVETKCGGFVGNNDKQGKIDGCTSIGSAEGQEYVGGFCGESTGEISNSNSSGNAKASTKVNTNRCGGFIGENIGIVKDSNAIGSAIGEEYVGGFVGVNKSEIVDCNAYGKATAKTKIYTALAGGFVGENEKGTIISCTAKEGADSRSSSGQAKAGGFVGINKASIMDSKASGNVYLSAGTCYKDDGCGGFVGKNDKGGSIDGCYAECIVETTNKKKGGSFVGEAKNKSTIKNCQCKTKIVTKSGTKINTKFCENKDKKAVVQN